VPESSGIGRGSGRYKSRSQSIVEEDPLPEPEVIPDNKSDAASIKFNEDYA